MSTVRAVLVIVLACFGAPRAGHAWHGSQEVALVAYLRQLKTGADRPVDWAETPPVIGLREITDDVERRLSRAAGGMAADLVLLVEYDARRREWQLRDEAAGGWQFYAGEEWQPFDEARGGPKAEQNHQALEIRVRPPDRAKEALAPRDALERFAGSSVEALLLGDGAGTYHLLLRTSLSRCFLDDGYAFGRPGDDRPVTPATLRDRGTLAGSSTTAATGSAPSGSRRPTRPCAS